MNSRTAIKVLLALVLGLPLLQAVFGWVGGLLTAMGDGGTAGVLGHVSTAVGIVWLASVVGLLIAIAVYSLDDGREG